MALEFDGTDQAIEDTDGENYINGLSAITACIWIKSDSASTDKGFVFGLPTPDGTDKYIAMRYDSVGSTSGMSNGLKMGLSLTSGEHNRETSSSTQTTDWQHCLFKWSAGNDIRIFLDGSEDTLGTGIFGPNTGTITNCTTLALGIGSKDGSSGGWDGLIDDFRIYNRALGDNEIQTIYAARGADRIVHGLQVRYVFRDFTSGTTLATTSDAVKDIGPNGNRHATRTGSTGPVYRESVLRLVGRQKR